MCNANFHLLKNACVIWMHVFLRACYSFMHFVTYLLKLQVKLIYSLLCVTEKATNKKYLLSHWEHPSCRKTCKKFLLQSLRGNNGHPVTFNCVGDTSARILVFFSFSLRKKVTLERLLFMIWFIFVILWRNLSFALRSGEGSKCLPSHREPSSVRKISIYFTILKSVEALRGKSHNGTVAIF